MNNILQSQRDYFKTDETKSYAFRKLQLQKLYNAIIMYEELLTKALYNDLHKSPAEAYISEIGFTLKSIKHTIKNLRKWMRTKKVKTPWYQFPAKSYTVFEPLGQVLIIGPYNYPFHLIFEPLIGAIAAGNTAIIKPSEDTEETTKIIKMLIDETYDPHYIYTVTGDKEVTSNLLKERFDHIFFTGSTRVGKIVYQAAAKHLTPVTLELGGKSPAIIEKSAHIAVAAKRIVFGKFLNAGQTCVAPDYVYLEKTIKDKFIKALIDNIEKLYPDIDKEFGRIVSDKHFQRLINLIDKKKVIYGGDSDSTKRLIFPTIIDAVSLEDAIMQEEIFGPILPIITYDNIDEVITMLKHQEKPLALYLFTENQQLKTTLMKTLSYGGGAINDTILQIVNPYLPFGGVGMSGIGAYHGVTSFETFSHCKSIIRKSTRLDFPVAYPPYHKKIAIIRKILK